MDESGTGKAVDDYIENQPVEVKKALIELRRCIRAAAPDATEMINYGIPAFALVPGGKRDQQIMIAGYKKHVGLYPHPAVMEHFDKELGTYKRGKGSVQFPLNRELPKELIAKMVNYRLQLLNDRA